MVDDHNVPYSDGDDEAGEVMRNFKKTACHELGHSLGFFHHPLNDQGPPDRGNYYDGSGGTHAQDCMVRGHLEQADNWMRYNQHHRDHINNYLS